MQRDYRSEYITALDELDFEACDEILAAWKADTVDTKSKLVAGVEACDERLANIDKIKVGLDKLLCRA